MRLGNLPAQDQPDARPRRLGREERHEEVTRIGQARTFIVDMDLEQTPLVRPRDRDAPAGLERGIDGVANRVDEQLLELIENFVRRTSQRPAPPGNVMSLTPGASSSGC